MRDNAREPSIHWVIGVRKRSRSLGRAFVVTPALLVVLAFGAACSNNDGTGGGPAPTSTATSQPSTTTAGTTTVVPTATPTFVLPEGPSTERLAAANQLLREGRFDQARSAFEQIADEAETESEAAEAWFGAGAASHEGGDIEASVEALRTAYDRAPSGSSLAARSGYMLAKRLNDAGSHTQAAEVARAVEPTPVLRGYVRNELARALVALGRYAEANQEWDTVLQLSSTSNAARAEIYRARIAIAEETNDTPALSSALDGLIAVTGEAAARFQRAALAREAEEWGVFEEQLQAIIANAPSSSFATRAITELRGAGFAIDPGREGLVYYRRDAYTDAKRVLLPALDDPNASAADRTFRAYYLAASYEDSGDLPTAVTYYDIAASTGASSPFVHRAKYWAARVAEAAGDMPNASRRYVALVVDGPAGEFTEESAFRAGYVLFRGGDTSGALGAWAEAGAGATARLEYWRGRALEDAGDSAGANAAYERALNLGAYDFHGLEAAVRLGLRDSVVETPYVSRELLQGVNWDAVAEWLRFSVPGDWPGSGPTAACDLMAAGLRSQARAELNAAAEGSSAWRTLEITREAHICGVTDVAARMAVKLRQQVGVKSHEVPKDLLRVAYPIEYAVTLDNHSRQRGIDPLFLAAMVRQESFWDPGAGSHAGALGLTQVIPPTGQGIANALGHDGWAPADLFRPAVSLEFGAYYLGGQINRFGSPLLALTAYNAGPGNAARWMTRPRDSAADLVESIDINETKLYVTYIYESYAHYQLAWAD